MEEGTEIVFYRNLLGVGVLLSLIGVLFAVCSAGPEIDLLLVLWTATSIVGVWLYRFARLRLFELLAQAARAAGLDEGSAQAAARSYVDRHIFEPLGPTQEERDLLPLA